jgi:competence protein ComGC
MRTWFIVAVALVLGAVLLALSIPAVSTGIGRTETTEALSNCRQIQIAVKDYFEQNGQSPASLSMLLEAGIVDKDLFHNLTTGKGVYLIYFREDMRETDIFMEAYLPKVHVTMTAGGDGMVTPSKYHKKQK